MYKQTTEYKSIQKKLVAAVAMVLVAAIMVVSSSYAWFTLSTAPEVTGITTAVGSNGNLEMALRTEYNYNNIGNAMGETMPAANAYWGNLVDLSYNDTYGLDKITLAPARLNAIVDDIATQEKTATYTEFSATENGFTNYEVGDLYEGGTITEISEPTAGNNPADNTTPGFVRTITTKIVDTVYKMNTGGYLQTPEYGTDGRVTMVNANTINGIFDPNQGVFKENTTNAYGVRAIGVTSNISPQALALRQAKQTVSNAISDSKNGATASLKNDAVKLANILIQYQLNNASTFTGDDLTNIQTAIDNLTAVADLLENALKEAVVAVGVSQGHTFTTANVTFVDTDTNGTYDDIQVKVGDNTITLNWAAHTVGSGETAVAYPDLTAAKADLLVAYNALYVDNTGDDNDGIRTKLNTANDKVANVQNSNAPTYAELSSIMTTLLSTGDFTITKGTNTYTIAQLMALGTAQAGIIMAGEPTINLVKGIYHDIALFSGDYGATTSLVVNAPAYDLIDMELKVYMQTQTTAPANGYYLPYVLVWMAGLPAPGGATSTLITDTYGYVLDFAFRTNAIGSNLLLQTAATSRVGTDATVQGGGSFMAFKSGNSDFTVMQVLNLMGAIRVVFVNDDGDIYGVAALDVSLDFMLDENDAKIAYDETEHDFYIDETVGDVTTRYAAELVDATLAADGTIKANLYMYSFSMNGGVIELGAKSSTGVITDLQQNVAEAISTLVFLDGDKVENADVAISGNSMSGTMNLQFASSADLVPMDYTFDTKTPLAPPTAVSFDKGTSILSMTDAENAASYDLYYGDVKLGSLTKNDSGSYDLSAVITALQEELSGSDAETGEYTIWIYSVPATDSTEYSKSTQYATFTYNHT